MIKRSIAVVILLAVISLGLITAGQVYWVTQAYQLQEDVFASKVNSVLINVVNKVHLIENDQSIVDPPKTMGRGSYIISLNHTPSPYLLQTLLEDELQMQGVLEEVEYGVFDCFSNQYEVKGWIDLRVQDDKSEPKSGLKLFPSEGHYLSLYFPQKNIFLFKRIDFWMYSSVVIFLIFVFFAYTIGVLFREKRLSTVRNDFVNNMTHEFKTPIATISLAVDALRNEKVQANPEKMAYFSGIIKDENIRMNKHVETILQAAHMDKEELELKLIPLHLHELIESAIDNHQLQLKEKNGNVALHLEAIPDVIMADEIHFSNLISNLIDNAIKYAATEPIITISTYIKGSSIFVSVADNGIGMTDETVKRIFEKFYRAHTGNLHNVKGFGLGMSYVKWVMDIHKGSIKVDSVIDKGTTITLLLPI